MKIALIAAGTIGQFHAKMINRYYAKHEIKTLVDRYASKDSLLQQGIEVGQVVTDLTAVLEDDEIEAVIVATSTAAHVEICEKLIAAKKHIFCEKPVSHDFKEILRLGALANEANIKFQIAYVRRFDPNYAQMKERYQQGEVGQLYMMKIVNRDPKRPDLRFASKSGGLFVDFICHDLDMIQFITEQKIVKIYVEAAVMIEEKLKELDDFDTTLITFKLENGAIGMIDCSRETNYGYDQRMELFGSKSSLRLGLKSEFDIIKYENGQGYIEPPLSNYQTRYFDAFVLQMGAFFQSVIEDTKPIISYQEAAENIRLANACKESVIKQKPIFLDV